ncbi:MAG: MFS transporter [Acidimicrobiales bacterium]|nr:MFS transporter [Acidimicrobiales bacterium]MDG1878090.1 MFS transporter [Acidimicrobiales bacterium]
MATDPATTPRFESLAEPEFRRLWWGGLFVFLAMQTQQIARSWLAFELTGTNTALGGVLIGFGIAGLVAIPTGGVLADRVNKRTILVSTQLINTGVAVAIAIAIETDALRYWMIVVASVIGGSTISILAPARMAMTAEIIDRDRLTNAIMLGQMSAQASRVVGPAVAGFLIGVSFVGAEGVYFLSALLSLFAVGLSMVLPLGEPQRRSDRSPIDDLREGIRYTRSKPELVRLLVASLLIVMFGFAYQAFLPSMVADLFGRGAGALGTMTTVGAIGAVIMSIALANTPSERLADLQGQAAFALGLTIVLFAAAPTYALALGAMFLIGAATSAFQSLNGSLILSLADMEYHGRVQSLIMLSFSAFGLAALPFGMLADAVGLRETLAGMGVVVCIAAVHSHLWRRRLEAAKLEPSAFDAL